MHYYDLYESPQGQMLLVANGAGLSGVYFDGQKYLPQSIRIGGGTRATRRCAGRSRSSRKLRRQAQALRDRARARRHAVSADVWKAISAVGFRQDHYVQRISRSTLGSRAARAPRAPRPGAIRVGIIVPCHAS